MSANYMDEFARRQILSFAEMTLQKAGVVGIIPTPLAAVAEAANILDVVDIGDLPTALAKQRPSALRRILGALVFHERIAYVDFNQIGGRARLTEAHEIGHKILPWHETAFRLDGAEQIAGSTQDILENEAYLAGGHLLFQGTRFHKKALEYEVSVKTPLALAEEYDASLHATIRYYVLHHPDAVALLIAGRYMMSRGSVPLWRSIESPSFYRRFGSLSAGMNGILQIAGGQGEPFGNIAQRALAEGEIAAKSLPILDLCGDPHEFVGESFFNGHNLFIMVSESKARRFSRRIQMVAG